MLLFSPGSTVLKATLSGDHSGLSTLVPTGKQLTVLVPPSQSTPSISVCREEPGQACLLSGDSRADKMSSVFLRAERESSIPKVDRASF